MSDYSLSDIAAATGNEGFGGGGSWLAWILIFAMLGGGFGFGNRGNAVTESDLCNANSFNELKGSVRDIADQIGGMNVGLTKGLCDFGYTTLGQFNALERQLADCCCTTQRAIDSVKFDMSNYAAATNANTTAGIQKILDKLSESEKAAMAQRIQTLELQQALCGVVRYPTATTYAAQNPLFGCAGCGYNNI